MSMPTPEEVLAEIEARHVPTLLENTGQTLFGVHNRTLCQGRPCTIHNRSEHHMRSWPQHFRADRGVMERICSHGIGHPDPDDLPGYQIHGCDGCCVAP